MILVCALAITLAGWRLIAGRRGVRPGPVIIDRHLPGQVGLMIVSGICQEAPTARVLSAALSGGEAEAEARHARTQVFLAEPYLLEDLEEALE